MATADREVALIARIGRLLIYAGASVAVLGVSAWIFDVIPAMPAWMLRIAVYKLTLVGAAGILFAGAALRRAARKAEDTRVTRRRAALGGAPPDLAPGAGCETDRVYHAPEAPHR